MFRRLVSRRTLKWSCTTACAVFVSYAALSFVWLPSLVHRGWAFGSGTAVMTIGWVPQWQSMTSVTMFARNPDGVIHFWLPRLHPFGSIDNRLSSGWVVIVPVWLPTLIVLLPALYLWRLDRHRPLPGHCKKCNYDLTGNTSGRCPECGSKISKSEEQRAK